MKLSESGHDVLEFKIQVEGCSLRLDQAVLKEARRILPSLTRSQLKGLFEEKRILLEGRVRAAAWTLLPGTHSITILNWQGAENSSSGQALASTHGSFLSVLYEDADLFILDKTSGVPSVPHAATETETAIGSALAHFPAIAGIGRGGLEPGLLHRLDTGTSGALAFAKTQPAFDRLQQAWRVGEVTKTYRALVLGDASKMSLPQTLRLTMAHHVESRKRMIVIDPLPGPKRKYRGKPLLTITHLRAFHGVKKWHGETVSDLEVEIETGVMHQIRCTLAHLGMPIVGDSIYTPAARLRPEFTRLFLHAWKLELPGVNGQKLSIAAPIPEIFH